MDELTPHLLSRIEHLCDRQRDILELQRDHSDTLQRIETRQFCRNSNQQDRPINWGKIMPTIIWAAVLVVLLVLQIPLKDAVAVITKLSTGL